MLVVKIYCLYVFGNKKFSMYVHYEYNVNCVPNT